MSLKEGKAEIWLGVFFTVVGVLFLAVIIPPARNDKAVGLAVLVSFACSFAAVRLPFISGLSQGNRTILLTVVLSALFAILFPRKAEPEGGIDVTEGGGADAD